MTRVHILASLCVLIAFGEGAQASEAPKTGAEAFVRAEQAAAEGRYQAAFEGYQQALGFYHRGRDLAGAGRSLNRIARIYCDLGHFDKSREIYAKARTFLDKNISYASINYRLSGEAPLPAPVHDAARANVHHATYRREVFFASTTLVS